MYVLSVLCYVEDEQFLSSSGVKCSSRIILLLKKNETHLVQSETHHAHNKAEFSQIGCFLFVCFCNIY